VLLYDQKSGRPQGTFSQPTIGEVTDAEGNKSYVPTGGGYKPYVEPVKAPINPKPGGGAVDRTNGLTPLGGPLPPPPAAAPAPAPAPPNTALVPRFMRGAGDVIGEGVQSFTDPLRSGATGLNQLLFNSGAQQDPEVLKRMEERARRNPLRRPDSYGEAGY
jgi:hypothetical protein